MIIDKKNVTIGSDPEFFIKNKDSEIVSAIGIVGGTKDEPKPLEKEGYFVQEDNVMVEFCIPPSKSSRELILGINTALLLIEGRLNTQGYHKAVCASAEFDLETLIQQPKAMEFGCDPDFNAYTGMINNVNADPFTTLRTAGGHIHIGYDNHSEPVNLKIIKAMDLFLGVPSILMDSDKRRREIYGKAGCFRHKKYGVEYRVLSNFWIFNSVLIDWAYEQTLRAIDFINNGNLNDSIDFQLITRAIDTQDVDLASQLIKQYNLSVVEVGVKTEEYA